MTVRLGTETTKALLSTRTSELRDPLAAARSTPPASLDIVAGPTSIPRCWMRWSACPLNFSGELSSLPARTLPKLAAPLAGCTGRVAGVAGIPAAGIPPTAPRPSMAFGSATRRASRGGAGSVARAAGVAGVLARQGDLVDRAERNVRVADFQG